MQGALAIVHRTQGQAGLPTPPHSVTAAFFDPPFLTIRADTVEILLNAVTDPIIHRLPRGIGSIEQWVDNVKVLADPARRVRVARHQLEAPVASV